MHRFLEKMVRVTTSNSGNSQSKMQMGLGHSDMEETKTAPTREEALTGEEFASKLSEVAFLCDEWWEVTHEDNINNLEKVFRHDMLRRAVR